MTPPPPRRPVRAWMFCACLALGGFGGCATAPGPTSDAPPAASGATPPVSPSGTSVPAAPNAADQGAADAGATDPGLRPVASTAPVAPAAAAAPAQPAASVPAADTAADTAQGPSAPDAAPERQDLWQRIRDGLRLPDLDNESVRKWEQWYASRPEYVQRMTERGSRYLFYIVDEVERRGLPTELALLPFIESAFNPQAMSSARAAGMWQFMPATGKDFELRQNLFRDDRRDVLASTRAALDYLEQLYARFGDWQLALAAYNWGPGNVQRAAERLQRSGLEVDFESLQRLPQETREYVPKLQAVKNIVRRPADFGLALPALENHPYFLSVPIERDIDVVLAARLAGLEMDEFRQLNPQHNKPVILAAGTPHVLLPYDAANRFQRELSTHAGPLASWTAWVAPRTLKTAEAARLTRMDEARLREVNQIPPRMLVKVGSTLLVPRAAHAADDVPEHIAEHANLALAPDAPPLRRVTFKAGRKGDTVAAVARRYRVSAAQVAQWNGVAPGARFAAGQSVVVMLPPARAHGPARAGTATSARVATSGPKASDRVARRTAGTPGPARVSAADR